MKKLMQLEFEKISLKSHLVGLLIANIIILFLSISTSMLMIVDTGVPTGTGLPEMQLATSDLSTMLVRATMLVWQSVLIVSVIIKEYKDKTMNLLFTYPINRTKLIVLKLLLICGIMFLFLIGSNIFQHIGILVASNFLDYVTYSTGDIFSQIIIMIATICMGLLPLCIGMVNNSTIATIVSSIILVSFVSNSQGNDTGILSIPIVATVLGLIGLLSAIFTIKKMGKADL